MAVAVLLRLPLLFESLWYDEAFTLWLAKLDLQHLGPAIAGDVHPPLWYIIEWFFVHLLGTSPLALRLPALICGLLALWLAALVYDALPVYYRLEPVALAGLVASPFLIYYSGEARMYGLLLVLVLFAALMALRQNYLFFGLALGWGMLTHNLFVIYAPALIALYLVYDRNYLAMLQALIIGGLIYLPWMPLAYAQVLAVQNDYWIFPPGEGHVIFYIFQLLTGYSLADDLAIMIIAPVSLILLALGTIQAAKHRAWELLGLAYSPLAVGLILSYAVRPVLISRVLIGIVPFVMLLIVWGGWFLYQQAGRWLIGFAAAAVLVCLSALYTQRSATPDYREIYGALPVQAGDLCYHIEPSGPVLASVYLPQCRHVAWPDAPQRPNSLSRQTMDAMAIDREPFELSRTGQTWIFHVQEWHTDPAELDYLADLLIAHPAEPFMMWEDRFVKWRAWRVK